MSTEIQGKTVFHQSDATNNKETTRQARSPSLTRDELLTMAREEYARQLSKFTESQMKKQQRLSMPVSAIIGNNQKIASFCTMKDASFVKSSATSSGESNQKEVL
ncbi:hypothetical protein BJV82DRAFT_580692 [Fennellomyces sp. T-0311]|nr:hypothetical protein BJV82DRAFT_580692 [Fennellomyces sp. T-0311]